MKCVDCGDAIAKGQWYSKTEFCGEYYILCRACEPAECYLVREINNEDD